MKTKLNTTTNPCGRFLAVSSWVLALMGGLGSTSAAPAQGRDLTFGTKAAMYAANEEWLTFACESPDGQVPIGAVNSMEMYYYSRYALGNLLFRSGMGVHIVHNPLFKMHAEQDKGMPWYQKPNGNALFFKHKLGQFVKRTGSDQAKGQFPPKGAYPVYLEFSSGNPSFLTEPVLDDLTTLRWDPAKMDKSMNPGAWGQSLMKQVLWARDFFTHHKTIDGVTYFGNEKDDGGNGFRGAALTAMAITKSFALKSELAYHAKEGKLGGVDPATYNPADGPIYYPHRYEVDLDTSMMPPKPKRFRVTDKRSHLFDVASLLWGESEFYFYTDPTIKDDYDVLFGDPKWDPNTDPAQLKELFKQGKAIFPAKPHQLSKGISAVNFKNMMALHFRKEQGSLVDSWHPKTGKSRAISTSNAGMAMVALANAHHRLHDVAPLRDGALKLLTAQANFLLARQDKNGSVANAYMVTKTSLDPIGRDRSLLAQTFAIRGWLAAYHATKNDAYLKAADRTYAYIEKNLWSETAGVFRAHRGSTKSTYDGLNFASTIGALRELAIVREGAGRTVIVAKLDSFFDKVGRKNGLQIAEIGAAGEMIPTLAKRKEMKEKLMALKKSDPKQAMKMMAQMRDSDGDGVPKPLFVANTKHGAAPVQAGSVVLQTP